MTLDELNNLDRDAKSLAARAAHLATQRAEITAVRNRAAVRLVVAEHYGNYYSSPTYRSPFREKSTALQAIDEATELFRDEILRLAEAKLEQAAREAVLKSKTIRAQLDAYLDTKPEGEVAP